DADDFPFMNVQENLPATDDIPLVNIEDIDAMQTRLTLNALARDQNYICLRVEDTGTGMSRDVMEQIFEPFFTTKPLDKGTGLGMAMVHGVVVSHRGAMIIHSTLGEGTVFDLLFPVLGGQSEQGAVAAHQGQKPLADISKAKILLVEDQDNVRDMLVTLLKRLGYQADTCIDGLEAIDMIREKPGYYDLVLTDQNMPKMTGFELIQQISFDAPDLPFILISGYSQEKMRDLMKEHGSVKAILKKPVSRATLSDTIQEVLERKAGQFTHAA
ncbi:MAG: response regulator, partial [Bdellovibrionales bacterium]